MTDTVPEKHCEEQAQAQLKSMVEDFFVLGLEYARVKTMGVTLQDGALVAVHPSERDRTAEYLLDKLAQRAVANLARMTAYPGENAAMTPQERAQRRETRQQRGEAGKD